MANEESNCIFCKIAKGQIKSTKVAESNNLIAILDINPKAPGHTLVIPKQHLVTLLDIPNKLGNEILEFIKKISGEMLNDKTADGFNVIMNNLECAGQVVKHAHIHIIPRKENDGLVSLV